MAKGYNGFNSIYYCSFLFLGQSILHVKRSQNKLFNINGPFAHLTPFPYLRHMIAIELRKVIRDLDREHKNLSVRNRKAGLAKAINRALVGGRAKVTQDLRTRYNVQSKDVKKTIALRKANAANTEGRFTSTGSSLPIAAFRPSVTKKGITVRLTNARERFPGAFMAKTKSGHKGVFARAEYKSNKLVSRRKRIKPYPANDLPITEVRTFAVPSALSNKGVLSLVQTRMRERVAKEYAHELKFRAARAAGLL